VTIQCFIVEDSELIRTSLIAALEELLPLHVMGCADTESLACDWLSGRDSVPMRDPEDRPGVCDLVIIDVFLKSGSGLGVLDFATKLRRAQPADSQRMKLVVLTNYATPDLRRRAMALGADAIFDKSEQLEELIDYCAGIEQSQVH